MPRGPMGNRRFEDFREPDKLEQGGIIRISGNFLLDHEDEIVNLIKHEGRLAESENPQHKVKTIKKSDGKLEVEISNSRLAMHIGKRLNHAYKGTHAYKFSKGEKFVEIEWRRD